MSKRTTPSLDGSGWLTNNARLMSEAKAELGYSLIEIAVRLEDLMIEREMPARLFSTETISRWLVGFRSPPDWCIPLLNDVLGIEIDVDEIWRPRRGSRKGEHCGPEAKAYKFDEVGYGAIMMRLRYHKGRVRDLDLDCVLQFGDRCKGKASQWAYNGLDPDEKVSAASGSFGARYSTQPQFIFYVAVCVPCASRMYAERAQPVCEDCGEPFIPGSVRGQRCEPCKTMRNFLMQRDWWARQPRKPPRVRPIITHCPRGHPYTMVSGRNRCLICENERAKEYQRERRAGVVISPTGVCIIDPDRDSAKCPSASRYNYGGNGCRGDACREIQSAYSAPYQRQRKSSINRSTQR